MVNSLFIAVVILVIITFFSSEKVLHPIESVFLWMMLSVLLVTVFDILASNMEAVQLSRNFVQVIIQRSVNLFYYPFMIILCFNYYLMSKSITKRALIIILCFIFLCGMEYYMLISKILQYKNWTLWKTAVLWSMIVFVTLIIHKYLKKTLFKDKEAV